VLPGWSLAEFFKSFFVGLDGDDSMVARQGGADRANRFLIIPFGIDIIGGGFSLELLQVEA
jgi:hypothetical protein